MTMEILKDRLTAKDYGKIVRIDNPPLHQFLAEFMALCDPDSVCVCDDSPEDANCLREAAIKHGEETPLALAGHTAHFDSFNDQGRDKNHTRILVPPGVSLDEAIAAKDREEGLAEIREILQNIMRGKEMYICFYCLGPLGSEFAIPCVQITDSAYVGHSENLLYRPGYGEFLRQGKTARFFRFVHSQGELDERKVSRNIDRRRIYIDPTEETVYSANTQYGGNSIGLKKMALRLAINRAVHEGWLAEHMALFGIHGPKGRVTYFAGAFPSLCGKTSTAMLKNETIVGDDIAYLHRKNGLVRAVNAERGMFGIIQGINSKNDPLIWKKLHQPAEIIFSNVLVTDDGLIHWIGKDGEIPARGRNHSGDWQPGKKDEAGKEIPVSHPNARFTFELKLLDNLDLRCEDPEGVTVAAIVYGGRNSSTKIPVEEAFNWTHGIITKAAALESETTAATLGNEGRREFNPMSNLDFLSVPISRYIEANLEFGNNLENPPVIFSVNYFLKDEKGEFLNDREDKRVWYKWMEHRVHGEMETLATPTGLIPRFEDLEKLFWEILKKVYSPEDYRKQFLIRIPENLAKIDRIETIYRTQVADSPELLFQALNEERQRLIQARAKYGDYILPDELG